MPFRSTRSRLITLVVLLLAIAFTATNLVNYQMSRAALKKAVVERELPLTSDTIYSEIQTDLVRPIYVSSQMAHDTFLRDWVLHGEAEPERIRRFLDEIRTKYNFFTAFYVSTRTHRYYHFTGVDKTVSEDDPRDIWFFRASRMEQDYEINVDPNQQQNDRTTIFINFKVKDYEGNILGVTGVGLELETMAGIVSRYSGTYGRTVYFAEPSGRITLHPDPAVSYQRNLADAPGLEPLIPYIMAAPQGAYEYQGSEGPVLLTTRYIPELDWVLLVEQRESAATAAAASGLKSTLLIGLAAIVLTSLAIGWTINRFQRRLETMASIDALTGLYNRQVFDASLAQALERARRNDTPLTLVLLDLDRFKEINDRFGHLNGDLMLKHIAELLKSSVRKSDVVARWGGEEFAVLMENCVSAEGLRMSETLRRHIAEAVFVPEVTDMRTTASFGVATLGTKDSVGNLMVRADTALYQAKQQGRNCVVLAAPTEKAAPPPTTPLAATVADADAATATTPP